VRLGQRLGELTAGHPVATALDDDHPEIYPLDSLDGGTSDIWHTDVTFVRRPPMASILRAVRVLAVGGDTNWADLELAYNSLSDPLCQLADQLTAVHDGNREWGYYLAQRRAGRGNDWDGNQVQALEPVEHPVVRSTAHYADNDYGSFQRIMHLITLRGDVPVGLHVESETP
jgi:alpha-ketoglutarate-dependent taurine dioxygenase